MTTESETVTIEPRVAVQWGDWCHLPQVSDGYPETFVCLSPGAKTIVKYWPVDEQGPAVARIYRGELVIVGTFIGAQADELREQMLRRLPQ